MAYLDEPEFRRWRHQADRTVDTAVLAADGDRPEWACFLAEQAAQQAVKGLLHGVGEGPWGHDLTVLVAKASEALGEVLSPLEDEAARLGRHYIPARYPDAHPSGPSGTHYRASDAEAALADARRVLAAVDGHGTP